MNTVYVISGPPAVGKSTVSKIIADSLSASALIHADQIYHMVVGGHLPPWKSDSQIVLMWDNILCLVSNFINSGVDVVVDAVAFPKDMEKVYRLVMENKIRLKYVILLANETTLAKRDGNRQEQMGNRSLEVLKEFLDLKLSAYYLLNTDSMTPEQVADTIMDEQSYWFQAID